MDNAISLKGLTVSYRVENGQVHVLRGVDLAIARGEAVAIVGESGCGKTTLALSIIQLLASNAEIQGNVSINNREVAGKSNKELVNIRGVEAGMIFQDPQASLNPLFMISEQIEETIAFHKKIKDKKILKTMALSLLQDAGIDDIERVYSSYPHQLSGGQQQRVMIAIALSCSPSVLIADEPTTALDVTVQAQIVELLKKLKKEKAITLLLITHDLHLAVELCARVVVMYAGEIAEDSAIKDENSAKHPYTRALFEIIPDIREKKRQFRVIPGSVPDLRTIESKCSYYGRCERGQDKCSKEHPELKSGVRCFYPY
jgi:oligopeptide/dipeptide ABC transporter ATP-binding protein